MTASTTTTPAGSAIAPRRRRADDVAGLGTARAGIFVAPALIIIGLFLLFPAVWTIWLGMTDYRLTGLRAASPEFVGFENYIDALTDPSFWNSLGLTLVFVVASGIVGQTLIGFALAWSVRNIHGWV